MRLRFGNDEINDDSSLSMFKDSNLSTSKIPQFCTVKKTTSICLVCIDIHCCRQIKLIMNVGRLCLRQCVTISFFKSTINHLDQWFGPIIH